MILENKKKILRNLYNNTIINFVDKKIPQKGALSKNGFKVYKGIIKQKNIIQGKKNLIEKIVSSKKISNKLRKSNKLGDTINFNDHLLYSEYLLEVFDSNVIDDIKAYLGNNLKLDHTYLSIFNTSNGLIQDCGSSGLFHHDSVGHRIKMFIPINSEGTVNNPTIYIAGTNKTKWKNYDNSEKNGRIRIDNEILERNYKNAENLGITGDDILIFDTNGIHKGSYFPTKENRILIQFEFSSNKSNLKGLVGPGTFYMSKTYFEKFKQLNLLRLNRVECKNDSIVHLGKAKRGVDSQLSEYI
tara:strand:+ start:14579 stop:15478 length:900 start_codon:yes stop_codon:yes gene_type:complete